MINLKMLLSSRFGFALHQVKIPSIDITRYLSQTGNWQQDCKDVANALKVFGLLVIKDPRVNADANNQFLDMMERYFVKRSKQYNEGQRTLDISSESNFQTGILHAYQEKFQSYKEQKIKLQPPNQSLTPLQSDRDPKWRYHWRVNNSQNVVPADFPDFEKTMNSWGVHMRNGCLSVAQMAAIGLGFDQNYLSNHIVNGDFQLSPTAIDLQKSKVGDVFAAFHRDFDLLTIHGKARYSGLFAWLNTGEKFVVRVPEGHLLLQAGKQFEWITGGQIKAGFHEVVHTEETEQAKQLAIKQGRIPWRISSTMFCQVQSKLILQPHPLFRTEKARQQYPPITAGNYLNQQLHYLTDVI